jgi:anti-anti-sigma factor
MPHSERESDDTGLQVNTADDAGWTVVAVTGEIDISTAGAFEDALRGAIESSKQVVVDLSGVRFMDSTGLGVLMRAHKHQDEAGAFLRLAAPSDRVVRILDVTQLDTVFAVYPSVDASTADV